jgi:hypothetical protein
VRDIAGGFDGRLWVWMLIVGFVIALLIDLDAKNADGSGNGRSRPDHTTRTLQRLRSFIESNDLAAVSQKWRCETSLVFAVPVAVRDLYLSDHIHRSLDLVHWSKRTR